MKTEVMTVTPEMAAKWLSSSTFQNRNLHRHKLEQYVRDMKNGAWKLNAQSISFDINGCMNNGYHRCTACVKAGVPFETLVATELSPDCYDTIDVGGTKIFKDFLKHEEEINTTLLSATLRWLYFLDSGSIWRFRNVAPTTNELRETFARHLSARESVSWISRHQLIGIPPSFLALLHYIATLDGNGQRFEEFHERIRSQVGLQKGDPELHLLRFLSENATKVRKASKEHIMILVLKAWHYARDGRRVATLRFRQGEETLPELAINRTAARAVRS